MAAVGSRLHIKRSRAVQFGAGCGLGRGFCVVNYKVLLTSKLKEVQ
jgi:hypothetical protein